MSNLSVSVSGGLHYRNKGNHITILIPVLNEQETIPLFIERMNEILGGLRDYTFEYLFVDGGSTDRTKEVLYEQREKDSRIKIIMLTRCFGKEAQMFCGLQHINADAVIPMDVDLQDPPEVIPQFIAKWKEGYDVVYGTRKSRTDESFLKRLSSHAFYRIFNAVADYPIPKDTGDFRLMSSRVVRAVLQLQDRTLFMKEMFHWVGFRSCSVPYNRPDRAAGTTKWDYWKLWNFALDGLTSSSTFPLRIWTYCGAATVLFSGVYLAYSIFRALFFGHEPQGYPTMLSFIIFFGAMQMIISGIQGEYIGRILKETKHRPLFIVEEMLGLEEKNNLTYDIYHTIHPPTEKAA